jgi:hypothetical protein
MDMGKVEQTKGPNFAIEVDHDHLHQRMNYHCFFHLSQSSDRRDFVSSPCFRDSSTWVMDLCCSIVVVGRWVLSVVFWPLAPLAVRMIPIHALLVASWSILQAPDWIVQWQTWEEDCVVECMSRIQSMRR